MIDMPSEITLKRSCQTIIFIRPLLFTYMLMSEPLKEYPGDWKTSLRAKIENLKVGKTSWYYQGGKSGFLDSLLYVCVFTIIIQWL